jgi:hypothetical protein
VTATQTAVEATTLDLAAIRQRERAATEGPWRLITDTCDCGGDYVCTHGDFPYALRLPVHRVSSRKPECNPIDPSDKFDHRAADISDLSMETAEFVAAAREDVPALLGAVESLAASLDSLVRLDGTPTTGTEHAQAVRQAADLLASLGLPVGGAA